MNDRLRELYNERQPLISAKLTGRPYSAERLHAIENEIEALEEVEFGPGLGALEALAKALERTADEVAEVCVDLGLPDPRTLVAEAESRGAAVTRITFDPAPEAESYVD